jgi:RNA polymerase sigma-70 factor (ECF subfamily)
VTTTETVTTTHDVHATRARREAVRREAGDVGRRLERHRGELTAFCSARLRSRSDAEDAVQETLMRAWRSYDRFRGESSLRAWLYRIAANVCIDMFRSPQLRALPMDLGPARATDPAVGSSPASAPWVAPFTDARTAPPPGHGGDPADAVAAREAVTQAFGALLHLPPRQRAALVLCDVLRWQATEAAQLLGSSVASVTSALQRARSALADMGTADPVPAGRTHEIPDDVLARHVDAFARCDLDSLVSLLR